MKETSIGLLVDGSSISSRAMLALVTRSFLMRSVGGVLGRVLSMTMSSLLALRPLAMMSTCSGFVAVCTIAVYVAGAGWLRWVAVFSVLSSMVVAVVVTFWTRLCSMLVFVVNCLVMSSSCCLIRLVILFVVLVLLVFLIRYAEARMPFLMAMGMLLVVLSCRRKWVMLFGSAGVSEVKALLVVRYSVACSFELMGGADWSAGLSSVLCVLWEVSAICI